MTVTHDAARASTTFVLPDGLSATGPPESRGLARDEVRLLVARPGLTVHTRFHDLADHLTAGDLVVVNTSATVAAALPATRADGREVVVHVSGPLADGAPVAELRTPGGAERVGGAAAGERLRTAGGDIELAAPWPDPTATGSRLWRLGTTSAALDAVLAEHGRPIRYGYLARDRPLADYQTVFADEPGSAEMASAGRPFSDRLVTRLAVRGVGVAPITLHTGVSSLEADEVPLPERVHVPATTAELVRRTRTRGGRVVAVGTTVTRALETAAADGYVRAHDGWTELVLGPDRPARVVDGLVTGWHEPEASHLMLLEAVAGADLVQQAYDAALSARYLWHEFGDSALFLP